MFLERLADGCGGSVSGGRGGVSRRFLGRALKITHWILSKTILEPRWTDEDDPAIKSRDARDFTLSHTEQPESQRVSCGFHANLDWTRRFRNEQSIIYRSQTAVGETERSEITFLNLEKLSLS